MTIAKYHPQAALASPISELFSGFFGRDIGQLLGQDEARLSIPAVNIVERATEFELHLMAPGYAKEELRINVEDDTLTLSANKQDEARKEDERYTRREFTQRSFSRSFRLPETVNAEAIKAEYVNGVLHVRIPKAEAVKPKAREITIG